MNLIRFFLIGNVLHRGGKGVLKKGVSLIDTWKAMEQLVKSGKVKSIGVSNFSIHNLSIILDNCNIPPAVNQVECHPYLQQSKLLEYCKDKGVHFTAYAPLGSSKDPSVMKDPVIQEISDKHQCTPAQVCLAWGLARGYTVIPKTSNLSRIEENWKGKEIALDEHDMSAIAKLDRGLRFFNPLNYWGIDCFDKD
jgi:diketogulonate reductase-like aldo/keto reductase